MLANGVDLDASSGMGAGPTYPMHVKPHGRHGERWERANVSQYGVNELACLRVRGVNIGVGMGGKLLYVLRLCVGGHIQALIPTHNPCQKAY